MNRVALGLSLLVIPALALAPRVLEPTPRDTAGRVPADIVASRDPASPAGDRAVAGRLYRWRDTDGTLFISSDPPTGVTGVEHIIYSRTPATPDPGPSGPTTANTAPAGRLTAAPLRVYTPAGFEAVLDEAARVGKEFQARDGLLDEMLDALHERRVAAPPDAAP
ncbi:MAG: DUF4124 domain-containing protein [Gammaproteobacteria bacterium]|nr:DUF4124 domain-containing protein [Gammaproteobacteria bacterium]